LWGAAEEAAVHFGASLADFQAQRPPGVQTFINVGDAYRGALQSQDTSQYRQVLADVAQKEGTFFGSGLVSKFGAAGSELLYTDQQLLDPRNEEFTYQGVYKLLQFLANSDYH
jgi:hypothetical protein